jgi:PAS domain S-box-containing protein
MSSRTVRVDAQIPMAAERRYRTVADGLPDVAVLVYDRDLRVELLTGAALRDPAWRPDEMVGRTLFELFPASYAEPLAAHLRAALAGERRQLELAGWRFPERHWSVEVVPVRGADGEVTGGMAFCRDVTERHRAEEVVRESRRRLAEAQRLARVGSWEWEVATGQVTASDEQYRLLGLEPGSPLDVESAMACIHPEDVDRIRREIGRVASDPAPYEVEHRVVHPDGSVRVLLVRGEGVCDESGRVVRILGTDQDVTEARQDEQQRQQLLARLYQALEGQHQRLAADLHDSHLQSLAAMGLKLDRARLLVQTDPERVRGLLNELRADVTVELTAMRRTIAALRPLVLDQRGLVAAVRELAAVTRDRAGLAECTVTDELGGERLDPELETVLFRVAQQALANVAQHAGAARVGVHLERAGSSTVLRVEDDGRGFDPVHAQVLAGHGGFGLTSMRERVQSVGGRLSVDSGPGRGTSIEARVPATAPEEPPERSGRP